MRTVNIQTHFHVETLLRAAHARSWPDSRIVHLAQTVTVSRKKEKAIIKSNQFLFQRMAALNEVLCRAEVRNQAMESSCQDVFKRYLPI